MKYLIMIVALYSASVNAGVIRAYENIVNGGNNLTGHYNIQFAGFDDELGVLQGVTFGFEYLEGSFLRTEWSNNYDTENQTLVKGGTYFSFFGTKQYVASGGLNYGFQEFDAGETRGIDFDLSGVSGSRFMPPEFFIPTEVFANIAISENFSYTSELDTPIQLNSYKFHTQMRLTIDYHFYTPTPTKVPESSSLALLSIGLLGLATRRRFI